VRALAAFVLLLAAAPAWATEHSDVIQPDRAGAATSATTARPGEVQLETGLQFARERMAGAPTQSLFLVEANLTVGLTERLEAAIDGRPLVRLRGAEDETGPGDLFLSLKYRFFDPPEGSSLPTLAVQPIVKFPIGPRPIGTGEFEFGLIGLAALELPWELGLDLNAGAALVGQPDGWLVQALLAAGLSRPVGRGLTLFTDLFFGTRDERDGRHRLGLDAGVIWAATRDLAFDVSVVTTLAGAGPDWAVRAGVSFRFGR
jgi:Putative MetA-pathway of phenol degradation